jgi:hypothetical protein
MQASKLFECHADDDFWKCVAVDGNGTDAIRSKMRRAQMSISHCGFFHALGCAGQKTLHDVDAASAATGLLKERLTLQG